MATPVEPTAQLATHEHPNVPAAEGQLGDLTIRDKATTTALPEEAHTNDAGVPSYLKLTGTRLINAITATSTVGFLLFGYDQGAFSSPPCSVCFASSLLDSGSRA